MKHCFHGNGIVLTSFPPQYPETCCWCKKYRTRSTRQKPADSKTQNKHGIPYTVTVNILPFQDEECPERPSADTAFCNR